eukprot:8194780-Pyramimonas_sp.AAC.1
MARAADARNHSAARAAPMLSRRAVFLEQPPRWQGAPRAAVSEGERAGASETWRQAEVAPAPGDEGSSRGSTTVLIHPEIDLSCI